jgi:hypothetical protein
LGKVALLLAKAFLNLDGAGKNAYMRKGLKKHWTVWVKEQESTEVKKEGFLLYISLRDLQFAHGFLH